MLSVIQYRFWTCRAHWWSLASKSFFVNSQKLLASCGLWWILMSACHWDYLLHRMRNIYLYLKRQPLMYSLGYYPWPMLQDYVCISIHLHTYWRFLWTTIKKFKMSCLISAWATTRYQIKGQIKSITKRKKVQKVLC